MRLPIQKWSMIFTELDAFSLNEKWKEWREIVSINQNQKPHNRKSCFSRNIDQMKSWQTRLWQNNYQFLIGNNDKTKTKVNVWPS